MSSAPSGEEWRDLDLVLPEFNSAENAEVLAEAEQNIQNQRLKPVTLQLQDAQGQALSGREVELELIQHDFPFGEQLWTLDAQYRNGQENSEFSRSWKQLFGEVFNSANNLCYWTERPQNDASKTEDQQGEQRVENFADTVDWTLASGLKAKGHPLFWSIPKCTPEWVKRYDIDTYWKFAEVRVRNLVARFKGRVTMWDAVNEALWEAAPQNMTQRHWPHIESTGVMADYIEKVLTWCREEDPDAQYLINDYGLISEDQEPKRGSDGSLVTASSQRKRYLALAEELKTRGCAPNAIGLQAHTGWVSLKLLQNCLTEMGQAGLPLHITEFWASPKVLLERGMDPKQVEEVTADYVRQFLTVCYGHPKVEAFFFWGFMNRAVNMNADGSYSLTPLFHSVKTLLTETWGLRKTLSSNAQGEVQLPLYAGSYQLRHRLPNGQLRGQKLEIRHPAPSLIPVLL